MFTQKHDTALKSMSALLTFLRKKINFFEKVKNVETLH